MKINGWTFLRWHWHRLPAKPSESKQSSYNPNVEKIAVIGRRFVNELVVLDGHSFVDCWFENVNFQFNGTAPFDLRGNKFVGRARLSTTNPVVDVTMIWLKAMGMTANHFEIVAPPGSTIEAPNIRE